MPHIIFSAKHYVHSIHRKLYCLSDTSQGQHGWTESSSVGAFIGGNAAFFLSLVLNPGQWKHGNFSGANEDGGVQTLQIAALSHTRRKAQLGLQCFS